MLSAIAFVLLNCTGLLLAIKRGPFWALIVYVNIYFNPPLYAINWWTAFLPFQRWSLLTSVILIISLIIHREKASPRKLMNTKWLFIFTFLSILITYTSGLHYADSSYTYKLITYCITAYIIVRSINNVEQYRMLCLFIIILASNLSLNAYLHASRVNSRLEGFGTADTANANHFALLLVNIIPFAIPFIFYGKRYEKIICLACLPFLLNAFILCNSRGTTVAFILGIILVFLALPDKAIRKYIFLIVLTGLPAFIYMADAQFIERMETLLLSSEAMDDDDASNELSSGRTVIWEYGFLMAKDNPFGAGPNAFKHLARDYMPAEILNFTKGEGKGVRGAHNTYLQTVVEQGIAGLIILLLLMFST